jgi:hypothetical protein
MTPMLFELGYMLLFLMPSLAFVLWFKWRRKRDSLKTEAPFAELHRRPAGESTRLRLEELSDKAEEEILMIIFAPIVLAVFLTFQPQQGIYVAITGLLICSALVFFVARKLVPIMRKCADYRLGFEGERYVAEELNQLIADGFQVFHDVPFEGFNIDHVLIGHSGVFSVETKTRRKPISETDGKEYKVVFDGAVLQYPWGSDTHGIDQSRRNAKTLSEWLTSAIGRRVQVQAVLALPGWWVERKGRSNDVYVINPKEVRSIFSGAMAVAIADDQIQAIVHQLRERSKLAVK